MYTKTIDVIPHTHAIPQATINQVLALPEEELSHGGTFTGKPSTRLQCSADYVLKINRNLNFASQGLAIAWATKQYEKEQASQLYSPEKTWFVQQTDKGWTAANISPRLQAIHTIIEDAELKRQIEYLFAITSLYLSYGAKEHERLDEGLSNFGVDKNGKMYYIDDDFYAWDHLLSFANMIALWIRLFSSSWLDSQATYVLGSIIKKQLNLHFSEHAGVDYPAVLIEHLKQQFFNEKSKTCMLSMCSALTSQVGSMTKAQVKAVPEVSIQTIEPWFEEDQPIAIISDVHANLPALNAVLDDIKTLGIRRILCLGDIVGYGPHPSECIQRLQQEGTIVIRGNHDYMVGSGKDFSHGSQSSLYVAQWTNGVISAKEREWLKTLPLQFRNKDMMLVHGAPRDPTFFNAYVYERTAESNLQWMNEQMLPVCFHGHSHLQGMYILQAGKVSLKKELHTYALCQHTASLICPGAVGQPRNGIPGAEYAIYYPVQKEVMFKRLEYDIAQVVADMKKFGFPEQLSTRLEQGS